MDSGPWGSGNNDSEGKRSKKKSDEKTQERDFSNNDFENFAKKSEEFLKNLLKKSQNNNGGNGGNNFQQNGSSQIPKSVIGLVVIGLILLWLLSGFYKVDTDENAITLYFGKYYSTTTPGLNYHIPYPFGQVIKQRVANVNTEEFGFASRNSRYSNRNFDAESLMLTGDENIVDIEFQVQWQISDIKDYVFNIANPRETIRKTAESVMREVIARTPIADALSDGKRRIELSLKDLLQETLDSYKAGVRITLVQLLKVDPPEQVINAFRDVQTAKADKEKEINQSQSYANDIIPRARGEAAKMIQAAKAYEQKVVSNAEGESGRFLEVYKQYVRAKEVTRKRIYLETMEEIYSNMDKIIIDQNSSKSGLIPFLPINEISKK